MQKNEKNENNYHFERKENERSMVMTCRLTLLKFNDVTYNKLINNLGEIQKWSCQIITS